MKNIVYKYGLISGALLIFFMFSTSLVWGNNLDYVMATIIGYITMAISFIPIFLGIKHVRNDVFSGFIDLKTAFKTGLGVVLIASVIYALGWMLFYEFIGKEFIESNHQLMVEQINASDLGEEELNTQMKELEALRQRYKSPFTRLAFAITEVLPPGLIVALLSSLYLMRKKPQ